VQRDDRRVRTQPADPAFERLSDDAERRQRCRSDQQRPPHPVPFPPKLRQPAPVARSRPAVRATSRHTEARTTRAAAPRRSSAEPQGRQLAASRRRAAARRAAPTRRPARPPSSRALPGPSGARRGWPVLRGAECGVVLDGDGVRPPGSPVCRCCPPATGSPAGPLIGNGTVLRNRPHAALVAPAGCRSVVRNVHDSEKGALSGKREKVAVRRSSDGDTGAGQPQQDSIPRPGRGHNLRD